MLNRTSESGIHRAQDGERGNDCNDKHGKDEDRSLSNILMERKDGKFWEGIDYFEI